jgi:3-vinyl bacteriochlorophyllide hydratase
MPLENQPGPAEKRTFSVDPADRQMPGAGVSLYTPAERARRDSTVWTLVQGVLAPVQFIIFLVSLALVLRYFATSEGALAADVSIIVKTLTLYTIMITGSIWEKVVFGKWLFAPAFFWEDVFSMLVLALHTAYLVMLLGGIGSVEARMGVALAGYGAYVINAAQFLWKLRVARLQGAGAQTDSYGPAGLAVAS